MGRKYHDTHAGIRLDAVAPGVYFLCNNQNVTADFHESDTFGWLTLWAIRHVMDRNENETLPWRLCWAAASLGNQSLGEDFENEP
jgi:hypothetical protein